MKSFYLIALLFLLVATSTFSQNTDPLKIEIITSDLDNFWKAMELAKPDYEAAVFQEHYLDKGSKGIGGFMKGRIESAENLAKYVNHFSEYYASIKTSTDQIPGMEDEIKASLVKLKEYYPKAIFPPVYFVIGTLGSAGTASKDGLIIGAEMHGLTENTPMDKFNNWLKTVLKPVDQIPHIVAHELIHFQQSYNGNKNLLQASIKEGSADFIAELISGKHINAHVHDFANPKEKELWLEFKERMLEESIEGWLYSSPDGRPNDLGYWMGYKISKAYFDNMEDKKQAVHDILNIKNFKKFLEKSEYSNKFND